MPPHVSVVLVSIFNEEAKLVCSKFFTAKWDGTVPCTSKSTAFLREKLDTLACTPFAVRKEYTSMFAQMQSALRRAASQHTGSPQQSTTCQQRTTCQRVQILKNMSCAVVHSACLGDAASQLDVHFGPLVLGYRVGGKAASLQLDAPAVCCHYQTDNQNIVLSSYTLPERKAETLLPAQDVPSQGKVSAPLWQFVPCSTVFSQHFVVAPEAMQKQAPVRRVLTGCDINRNLPCHAHFQSHYDARRQSKAEHDAVRYACGFSDAAWGTSELTCAPRCTVWATAHEPTGVHVASAFIS